MACLAGPPGANQEQISTFKAYIEQQAAANRDFMEKLLGAKDFQEAFRVQAEYFQSRLKVCAEDENRFCGHFSRVMVSDFRSLRGDIIGA